MTQESDLAAAKAQLIEDFTRIVGDTEALLRSLANVSGDQAAAMRSAVETNLDTARSRLRLLQADAADKASAAARDADAYVHENPWTAIGLAAAAGLIVGLMIGNRR